MIARPNHNEKEEGSSLTTKKYGAREKSSQQNRFPADFRAPAPTDKMDDDIHSPVVLGKAGGNQDQDPQPVPQRQ